MISTRLLIFTAALAILNACTDAQPACNSMPGTATCLNGGTCTDLGGTPVCECKPGFVGEHCETFDACSTDRYRDRCQNGGICVSTGSRVRCQCTHDYDGEFCEVLVGH